MAPLLVLWFGYEMTPKVILIVITTFFPITVGLLTGFKSADPDAVNLLRAMGAGRMQIFRYLKQMCIRDRVKDLRSLADEADFPMGTEGERDRTLDHGTMVPLFCVNQHYRDYRLVRIGGSGLPFADHYKAGQLIEKAVSRLGRRVVIIASGDLSHKLKGDGPYGYSAQGPEYDQRIMEIMGNARFGQLLEFKEEFCEKAGECGHRSFTMMAGAMDGMAVESRRLTYQGPFGVGYGICTFMVKGKDKSRHFLKEYEAAEQERCRQMQDGEDAYVSLARRSLEHYVRTRRMISLDTVKDEPVSYTHLKYL